MSDGITITIHGDHGPFSRLGKSIGYQMSIGKSTYLIDCGAPIFQKVGGHGLKEIDGLILTHCHDDHKRWFTDLILFHMYAPDIQKKLTLFTSEIVYEELIKSSSPSLDRSLSKDSRNVIDVAYEDIIDLKIIGPHAKYRITQKEDSAGKSNFIITDRDGNDISPDKAKIIINRKTKRPRMLFKDPIYKIWVEPESFYPFSSNVFYEEEQNVFRNEDGFTVEAINAHLWHGISGIGLRVKTADEYLIFSSDTMNNKALWKSLCSEKKDQQLDMPRKEFEHAGIIYGDINNYIEQTWSEERYNEAIGTFNGAIVIHDLSASNSTVHTNYEELNGSTLKKEQAILTHSPDRITSEWVLSEANKTFKIIGNSFYEMAEGGLYPMNADLYHKESGKYFVGYKNINGKHTVYEKDGLLSLSLNGGLDMHGKVLYKVDVYEDVSGKYYPMLEDNDSMYLKRQDGRVELIKFTEDGSIGKIVNDHRELRSRKGDLS